MREIKFRAFIKFNETMLQVSNIDFEQREVNLYSEDNKPNPCDRYRFDDIVLMQFTGLDDKNGKEICEGDIVLSETGYKWVVEFFNGVYHMVEQRKKPSDVYNLFEYMQHIFDVEVVGNIYENLELLQS